MPSTRIPETGAAPARAQQSCHKPKNSLRWTLLPLLALLVQPAVAWVPCNPSKTFATGTSRWISSPHTTPWQPSTSQQMAWRKRPQSSFIFPSPISSVSLSLLYAKSKDDDDDWNEEDIDLSDEDFELDVDIDDVDLDDDGLAVAEESDDVADKKDDDDDEDDEDEIEDYDLFADDDDEDEDKEGAGVEEVVLKGKDTVVYSDEEDEEYDEEEEGGAVSLEGATSVGEEWEEDGEDGEYPLEDDPDDPNYQKQKELVEQAVADSEARARDDNFDALDFVMNHMTEEQAKAMDETPFIRQVKEEAEKLMLTEENVKDLDLEVDVDAVSDLMDDDPYPRHEEGEPNYLEAFNGITDDDMEELDDAWKVSQRAQQQTPWDKVMIKADQGIDHLSNQTLEELEACLEEISGSAYNCTRWLLYDLDFNVENLILAAIKHNREAPIIFQHWYPQLVTYKRYEHCRAKNFDFSWEEVESADISELERYYAGFGYSEIPNKAPAETGIIEFEHLDEDEMKMAAFESWMTEVYNPEWDRKDFDDDEMRDEDNVFSRFYEPPQHPDLPTFEDAQEDLRDWEEEIGDNEDDFEYRDFLGRDHKYTAVNDEEFEKEFRGHLVVACTGDDADLEIAEKITLAMEKNFGKQIYVETRLIAHARDEDNVFEVWLESYEIELLHSKKRAMSNTKGWDGPAECDDKQVEYLVDKVRFMISDDARYSYSYECEEAM